jgi:alanine racemase
MQPKMPKNVPKKLQKMQVHLGNLKKATMGVIQITAPNSNEDFSYGGTYNTESKEKEASITIKLEYEVD